ncbi:MAG: energy-coupling factor transporter transmembrane protein EcfT [Bacillota bacterium]|nr:energy-coupling factor transporter transmembrane protein EcfT [Bacillota bacterium]
MWQGLTLGQYWPGHSFLHRLDPRTKILAVGLLIVALFGTRSLTGYGLVALLLFWSTFLARLPIAKLWRGLRPILILVLVTALINIFTLPGEVWTRMGPLTITREGVEMAILLSLRLVLLVWATTLMTLTTAPLQLTDGLETLFAFLKKVRVPVHEMALMMAIALRFIPTLFEEADRIQKAQMSRGADFESGSLPQRVKALLPLLVPLFVSSFRRAEELALAMEARAYTGGKGRTRYRRLRWTVRDTLSLALVLLVGAGAFALKAVGF